MKACAACGREVDEADLYMSGAGEVCAGCQLDDELSARKPVSSLTVLALGAGLLPFFASFSTSSFTTVNGVTSGSTFDYVAAAGGGVAVGASLIGAVGGLRSSNKLVGVGLPAFTFLLGIFQLIRGFGLL